MEKMYELNGKKCDCGLPHVFNVKEIIIGKNKLKEIVRIVKEFGAKKPYVFGDKNTFKACGNKVCKILKDAGINFKEYVIRSDFFEPDEKTVGSVIMNQDTDCDLVIGVGSGVINDVGKIIASRGNKPYVIVATAPSMDGYASDTSSVLLDGRKITLKSKSADVIIGDLDVIKNAPEQMLKAGLGDMLAKYVSILEWRISNLITGEYYCEKIAELVRYSLKRCVDNAEGLLKREESAVEAVLKGLIICGVAMKYAHASRPASGFEHYVSHCLDMRGAEFGTPIALHGLQCGIGTLYATKLYERLVKITPNEEKAVAHIKSFDKEKYFLFLKELFGSASNSMIELEKAEKKYDVEKTIIRIKKIIKEWDNIVKIIQEELPSYKKINDILDLIKAPKTLEEIGTSESLFPKFFLATKDIRDKYVLSRLCFDLDIENEILD